MSSAQDPRYLTLKEFKEELRKWADDVKREYGEDSGGKVEIRTHRDPEIFGTFAGRVTFGGKGNIDFLFVGEEYYNDWVRTGVRPPFDGQLEEVEFDTWPPESSDEALARSIFL